MITDVEVPRLESARRHTVVEIASGRRRPTLPGMRVQSSADGPWEGFVLEHHLAENGFVNEGVFTPDHLVVIPFRRFARVEWMDGDRYRTVRLQPNDVAFIPAACPFSGRSNEGVEFLGLSLLPTFLRCAMPDGQQTPGSPVLEPQVPVRDPFLTGALLSLWEEMERGYPGGRWYGETVATAIAAHVTHRFARKTAETPRLPGAQLSRSQLRAALQLIDDRLDTGIPLRDLADAVGLSPFHFCRVFKQSTGLTPHRYLVERRVERARSLLMAGGDSIAEVARRTGFCDQSHLTAHFKRVYGVTPRDFRRRLLPGPESETE